VLATVLDRKTGATATGEAPVIGGLYDHWHADIAQASDYYPGGMPMPGKYKQYDWSRMGYNGQAKDDEVYGKGNLNSAKFWEMDTRIIRRWNLDPVDQVAISNYAVFGNNSIINNDVLGDVIKLANESGESAKYNPDPKETMNDFAEGLKVEQSKSPFFVKDAHGSQIMQYDLSKYDNLTNDQKKIADNVCAIIDREQVTELHAINKDELIPGTNLTTGQGGGARTLSRPSTPNKVDIWLPKTLSDITVNERNIYGPELKKLFFTKAVVTYHEIGHVFYGPDQSERAVNYEDMVRRNLGMPIRGTHDAEKYRNEYLNKKK
jgi:hypothetical protein